MSLVAYGSSDSESDGSDYDNEPQTTATIVQSKSQDTADKIPAENGHISDEEDDLQIRVPAATSLAFILPKPKTAIVDEEDDDEFLRKKSVASERPPAPPKVGPVPGKASGPVKIVLPALSTFAEHKQKDRPIGAELPGAKAASAPGGLLGLLPKPKSIQFGQKTSAGNGKASAVLVPDSISRPKPKPVQIKRPLPKASQPATAVAKSDSEDSDSEDFFSLNAEQKLPEVSDAEIAAMVAKKSAEMSRAARPTPVETSLVGPTLPEPENSGTASGNSAEQRAIEELLGQRQAKRSRHMPAPENIIEISCDQVMPDRDEWMRTQLAGSTEYQPRGLVDSAGPGNGTKRKHQITYLAHQAKANEQELQAMWAANRNTRRQTQSKYGF